MPATANPTGTELLIDRAFTKRAAVAELIAELAVDGAAILALGKGRHSGSDPARSVTVVAAVQGKVGEVSYALDQTKEIEARELVDDPELFRILFERVVSFRPIAGFAHVVPTHLTPAKARDLVQLCAVAGKPISGKSSYIIWPK